MSLSTTPLALQRAGHTLLDTPGFELEAGRVHAVLGPNGAGKSTLLHALAGLTPTLAAKVRLNDLALPRWEALALARHRALLTQSHHMPFDFSVPDVVRLGRYPHGQHPHPDEPQLVSRCLARTDAQAFIHRRYGQLSGGEKARVQLARMLAQISTTPPNLTTPGTPQAQRWLLLDEPTAALDLAHQHAVMNLLREMASEGIGVLVVLHDLNLALRYADSVLVLAGGRLQTQGPPAQVLTAALVASVWGVTVETGASASGPWLHVQGLPATLQRLTA